MSNSEAHITATADFADSDTVSEELAKPEGFFQGATWSLQKLAAWLETTNIVADDELSQRTVDATKALIAEQARHAADRFRPEK
ncbi:MAG: hypothetical protein L0211_19730 [Planctomycetaceae bacterium]|nr:hypothetical protein [Planctomycetaceae bacterium]